LYVFDVITDEFIDLGGLRLIWIGFCMFLMLKLMNFKNLSRIKIDLDKIFFLDLSVFRLRINQISYL
jgi:hypothetical protein